MLHKSLIEALYCAIKEISDYNEKIIEFIQTKKFKTGVDKENNTIVLDGTGFYPNRPYTENDLITGIISVTFIDKNKQPSFDEMAKFISKYQYEAADIGFDLVTWMLAATCCLLAARCWLLSAGCWLLSASC